jgi:hypothetical protein
MNLPLTILAAVAACRPRLLPLDAIVVEARVRLSIAPPTYAEVKLAIADLERDGQLLAIANPDLGTRYTVTDAGLARLANSIS